MQQARAVAGLSERCVLLSAALRGQHTTDPGQVTQPETDFIRAYTLARLQAAPFADRVERFGQACGHPGMARPGGVKKLERIVEKYSVDLHLPLDLLAGKVVVGSLWEMYDVASRVAAHFPVVGYRDRVVRPQRSGYRDLQFVVDVGGHYAELKVVHRLVDALDEHEHRLYEIRRGLDAKRRNRLNAQLVPSGEGAVVLPIIEQLVLDTLEAASADLFQKTWALVLAAEQPPEAAEPSDSREGGTP